MQSLPLFTFPDFNARSLPLLILVSQGLIFVFLLFGKYVRHKNPSHVLLTFLLLLVCYHQTCYTVGFMGWYDTYRETKINYWLMPIDTAVAPLIYLYVRSITATKFLFKGKDWWHFLGAFLIIAYRTFIYTYDSLQPGFDETQNGILKITVDETVAQGVMFFLGSGYMLLYLAFTFQLFYNYRSNIKQYFSNTYKLELNWVLSFLVFFSLWFLYGFIQTLYSELISPLSYNTQYWHNIFMAILVLYIGITGYFTDTAKLKKLKFTFTPSPESIPQADRSANVPSKDIERLATYMKEEKPYLNPELNLSDLAEELEMTRAQLSQVINSGFQKNFNDFVNGFRVLEFKEHLNNGRHKQLSLLGIAYDCGFNSKATFNRVFKKLTQTSPTEFLNSIS
jgi:AraC-like DNA-binding protein